MTDARETARDRLGRTVANRRRELQLSVASAAREARISRGTWIGLEKGERETESYNYAGVERTLGWRLGSIDEILAGGDPELAEPEEDTTGGKQRLDPDVRRILAILADPDTPETVRTWIRDQLRLLADLPNPERNGQRKRRRAS